MKENVKKIYFDLEMFIAKIVRHFQDRILLEVTDKCDDTKYY